MVLPVLGCDWARRLARVCLRMQREPDGPVWFWSIRARILRFMVSRYDSDGAEFDAESASLADESSDDWSDDSAGLDEWLPVEEDVPAAQPVALPALKVQHSIKARQMLRSTAEQLHAVNEERRKIDPTIMPAIDMLERLCRFNEPKRPPGFDDRDYYCLQCHQSLRGQPSGRCANCDRPFLWENPMTYARRPPMTRRVEVSLMVLMLLVPLVPLIALWVYMWISSR